MMNHMYARYIDDQNIIKEAIAPGARYCEEKEELVIREELVAGDGEEPAGKRTFE